MQAFRASSALLAIRFCMFMRGFKQFSIYSKSLQKIQDTKMDDFSKRMDIFMVNGMKPRLIVFAVSKPIILLLNYLAHVFLATRF